MSCPPQPLGLVEKIIERGFIVFDSYAKARKTNHYLLYISVLIKKAKPVVRIKPATS